jgi:hypothetical protein
MDGTATILQIAVGAMFAAMALVLERLAEGPWKDKRNLPERNQ